MTNDEHVLDIVQAIRRIERFIAGLDEAAFLNSELHQSAVVKQLEIVGEAANRLSDDFRARHAQIPWRQIIGMRNRLVHDYTRIDVALVWQTVKADIGPLLVLLEPLEPHEESPNG